MMQAMPRLCFDDFWPEGRQGGYVTGGGTVDYTFFGFRQTLA